jgi:O-antigen ligase
MDRRIILIVALVVLGITIGLISGMLGPSMIVGSLFAIILLSLVFFSRGILIFLTIICLALSQSYFVKAAPVILYLRWVFLALFVFHIFGDIFLRRMVRQIKVFDVSAIIFIIYALLSIFYSAFHKLTLERTVTIFALYISVFWIIWKYAYTEGPEKIISLMLRAAVLIFTVSYLMIFLGPHRPFMATRFTGMFDNPNAFGSICAILLPLSLWRSLETKKQGDLLLFLMMFIGLLLSASRGSMQAAATGLGYFIYRHSKKYKPLVFFSSISCILILFWVIEVLIKEFFKLYIRAETIPVLGGRLEVWPLALNFFADRPIFGYGFGTEEQLLPLKGITHILKGTTRLIFEKHFGLYVHNAYLGMLLQLGIVGFILFFVPLFILLFKELSLRRDSPIPSLRYALQASLMAGLTVAFYESFIYSVGNTVAFPFWIIVMLLVFCRYQDKEKNIPEGT